MVEIIKGISKISTRYQAVFCDVWGVVHNGVNAHADACEALMQFRLQGKTVILVTNSPKTPSSVQVQLQRLGVPDTVYDAIVTAGEAAQYSFLDGHYKSAFFIGREDDRVLFTDPPEGVVVGITEVQDIKTADCVICAGPDYTQTPTAKDYEIELRQAKLHKLPLFCCNPDVVVDVGDERIDCAGAIAKLYEELGGQVYQFGKPFPPIYQLAAQKLADLTGKSANPADVLFIGDGADTDIKGAMLEDFDALFVAAGLAAEETGTNRKTGEGPDPELLDRYLNTLGAAPNFAISVLKW